MVAQTGLEKHRRTSLFQWFQIQDFIWIVLFAALVFYGPDRSTIAAVLLISLCAFQIVEPKIGYLTSAKGSLVAFGVKLLLCYILIGGTDAIASSYYWLLLLPVISAATSLGLPATILCTAIACAAYSSFIFTLGPRQYIPLDQVRELIARLVGLPMVGILTHQLAEAKRAEARRYQSTAEQLAEANRNLQEAQAEAARSQRLAALGQLTAGLAHELRNPLGTMKASAELLARSVAQESEIAREMAANISSEVDRTNSLITRFLDFARPLATRPERADLTVVLDRAISNLERQKLPHEVTVYKNYSPDIKPFPFDPELMERVFFNLLLNAAQASPRRGSITVKTRALDGLAEIAVIDRGAGIDPKHMEHIFNPFFTTKSNGVGLGLAIVSKIVDEHGGKISVESEPGNGCIFRVFLPVRD